MGGGPGGNGAMLPTLWPSVLVGILMTWYWGVNDWWVFIENYNHSNVGKVWDTAKRNISVYVFVTVAIIQNWFL